MCVCVYVCVCVFVLLSTCPCGVSESWGGDVTTSDSDNSGPRLHYLFLCSLLLNPYRPLLLTSNVCPGEKPSPAPPTHPSTSALLPHGIICPPGRPLYPSRYTKNTSSHTGSYAHLSVARLCQLHLPTPNPQISVSDSSSHTSPSPPARLPDSLPWRSLAAAEISSNVALNCFYDPACFHHGSCPPPPPTL